MTPIDTASTQLTIRRLLVTTAAVAVAMGLVIAGDVPLVLRLAGLAIGFYFSAVCVFSFSKSLSSPLQELLFLLGLPLYVCSFVCAALGFVNIIALIADLCFQNGA